MRRVVSAIVPLRPPLAGYAWMKGLLIGYHRVALLASRPLLPLRHTFDLRRLVANSNVVARASLK